MEADSECNGQPRNQSIVAGVLPRAYVPGEENAAGLMYLSVAGSKLPISVFSVRGTPGLRLALLLMPYAERVFEGTTERGPPDARSIKNTSCHPPRAPF